MKSYSIFSILFMISFPAVAMKVKIFSTGQGNAVLVRHNNQAIMIDAGSSESKFRALYHERSEKEEDNFELVKEKPKRKVSAETDNSSQREASFQEDSSESGVSMAGGANESGLRKIQKQYMEEVVKDIQNALPQENNVFCLKTLIITHADEDHYNLVPVIFNASLRKHCQIGSIILSGFKEDYNAEFSTWLETYARHRWVQDIIFTGMYDGGHRKEMGEGVVGYARDYYSGMGGITDVEARIEKAIAFTEEVDLANAAGGASSFTKNATLPVLQILSMNAGHALASHGLVRIVNEDKNANSLVLRLAHEDQSFLFAADASNATWEHIRANFWGRLQEIETDYVLLSHHGSDEEGATRKDILEFIKPKACFLSVGRHLGYHHPRKDTLDVLMSLPSLLRTKNHVVSYFGRHDKREPFSYKRRHLTQAVFSTLNHGSLSVLFEPTAMYSSIRTSSYKKIKHTNIAGQQFLIDYNNVYCVKERKTMDSALLELMEDFNRQNVSLILWKKEQEHTIVREIREDLLHQPKSDKEIHILIDEKDKRFYFLDQIDEGFAEDNDISAGSGSHSKAAKETFSVGKKRKGSS